TRGIWRRSSPSTWRRWSNRDSRRSRRRTRSRWGRSVRPAELESLLRRVRRGSLTPARAAREIAQAPLERLAAATVDHQRGLRVGFPEVVFGQGKEADDLVAIVSRLSRRNPLVLATRVDPRGRAALTAAFPRALVSER